MEAPPLNYTLSRKKKKKNKLMFGAIGSAIATFYMGTKRVYDSVLPYANTLLKSTYN